MRTTALLVAVALLGVCVVPKAHATAYDTAAESSSLWLSSNQHVDGSWCTKPEILALCTAEAVSALKNLNKRQLAFYAGLTWIENHDATNADYRARKISALYLHGDEIAADLDQLRAAQRLSGTGNKGWGLSGFYDGDPLDTALVLRSSAGIPASFDTTAALTYLKNTQLTGSDQGWRVADDGASDEIVTAEVIRALLQYQGQDPSLTTPINNGIATLTSGVTTSSSEVIRAHAALAVLLQNASSTVGRLWLDSLLPSQLSNGSWANDAYLTALISNSLALVVSNVVSNAGDLVAIPDANLRAAINLALGRNRGDAITRGDMARLVTLNAASFGIVDLTGLEYAVNLQSADLRFNQITSLAPLVGQQQFVNALFDGNPLSSATDSDNDGLNDAQELSSGTRPLNPDTDGDTMLDGADPSPTVFTRFPIAQSDSVTTNEDTEAQITVLSNDSDPDNDPLVVGSLTQPAHGSAVIDTGAQRIIYMPNADYNGADSFTYRNYDGQAYSNVATVNVAVNATNDPAVVDLNGAATGRDFAATYTEDAAPTAIVDAAALAITDVDSANLVWATMTNASLLNGSAEALSVDTGGTPLSATYDPVAGELRVTGTGTLAEYQQVLQTLKYQNTLQNPTAGSRSVNVRVNDGAADSSVSTSVVTVVAVNDPPVAVADSATTNEDVSIDINVMANDTDPEGNSLTVTGVSGAVNGTAALNANNTVRFTPALNFSGTGSFAYSISDGSGGSASGAVNVTIVGVNDGPTISDIGNQVTNEDSATSAIAFTVGDVETAAGTLTVTGTSSNTTLVPTGNIVLGGSGGNRTVTVTPAANQNGSAVITVTVSDGVAATADTFTLTVNAVNDAPTISDITSQATNEDTASGAISFSVGDIETSAGSLTVSGSSSNTTLVPSANIAFGGSGASRTVTLTPAANQNGSTVITVTVSDGTTTTSDTFTLTVAAVNDAPVSNNDSYSTNEDTALNVAAAGVLGNDTDVDGNPLTASVVILPTKGTLSLAPNGSFTYTPNTNANGSDSFTYKASDGTVDSGNATVTLTVVPVNDAPTLSDIVDQVTNEDTATGAITFAVSDVETAAGSLTITGSSSNTGLVPNGNIVFGGSEGNRTVTVTPAANQNGSAVVTVTVSDGADSTADTFTLTVSPVNDVPTISDITNQTINEDSATSAIAFTVGDVETAAGSLTVTGASSNTTLVPTGNIVLGGSGGNRTITVTPAANQNGSAVITVTVSDGVAATADTFTLTVNAVNDAPTVSDITNRTIDEDGTTGPVAFTIADIDNAAASLTLSGGSSNTSLVPGGNIAFGGSGANRTVTVTPAANQSGSATITVTVSDGSLTAVDIFTLTVNPLNDAPTISDTGDQATNEDTATDAIAFTVGDVETPPASLTLTASSSNGVLVPSGSIVFGGSGANRTVTLTPAANQYGSTVITVTVSDGTATTSDAFTLTVNAVNDAPVANNDAISLNEGASTNTLVGGATSVTSNDTDVEGNVLTVTPITGPAHAAVFILNADGTFNYQHDNSETTSDSFTYRVSDGSANSNTATVTISINPVNDAPVANSNSYSTDEDTVLTIASPGVLGNDTDAEGNALTAAIVATPTKGAVSLASNGGFTYTPNANVNGTDTFTYRANDGSANSNTATVTITINPVNDAPVASNNSYSTNEDTALTVAAPGVLGNDSDVDGDALTAVRVAGPTKGSLILNSNGSLTYTPNANINGTDTFTYSANDASLPSNTATVTITIISVNDAAPVARQDDALTDVNATVDVNVLANDTDIDGDPMTVQSLSTPSSGTATNLGSGVVRYSPASNFSGIATFTYVVNDGAGGTSTGTVQVAVMGPQKQYVLDPGGSQTCVVSLVSSNKVVTSNFQSATLSQYQQTCFSTAAGSIIAGTGAFSAGSTTTDMPVPKSLAGTQFIAPLDPAVAADGYGSDYEGGWLYTNVIRVLAVDADTVVTVTTTAGSTNVTVPKGQISTINLGNDPKDRSFRALSATSPIVAFHAWNGYVDYRDGLFGQKTDGVGGTRALAPAALEVWGYSSAVVSALQGNTTVTAYSATGSTAFVLQPGEAREATGSRLVADKPIAAYKAEIAGGDGSTFLPKAQFATQYGIPVTASSIEIVCYDLATQVTLTTSSGSSAALCNGSDTAPGTTTVLSVSSSPAGSRLESTKPIYVIVSPSTNMKANLTGSN